MKKPSSRTKKAIVRGIAWSFFEIVETLAISLAAVFLVRTFIAQPFLVSCSSMQPSFYDGNYLLVDEVTYRLRNPERGEVAVFKYPGNHRSFYIKRVIGLPGETVEIRSGKVRVKKEGEEKKIIEEEYITPAWTSGSMELELGEGEYFVMGDNRNFSFDSRSWGPVKKSELIGMVRLRLWPVNKVMAFTAPAY